MSVKKITIVDALGEAIYFDDELAIVVRNNYGRLSLCYILQLLRYETEEIRMEWEDLPTNVDTDQSSTPQPYYPSSLEDLQKHRKEVERQKRRDKIASVKRELTILEREEAEDHD